MHYWECPPTPPHSDIFGRYILVLGTKPTWKKKSFQMHNSVNLLFLFSKPFTAGIWVTEILQAWITHCGPVAGIEVQCEDWRVQSQGQGCWRSQEDWAESVTRLFRAGDKLVGEGGGKAVLRRGIRRNLGELWRVYGHSTLEGRNSVAHVPLGWPFLGKPMHMLQGYSHYHGSSLHGPLRWPFTSIPALVQWG